MNNSRFTTFIIALGAIAAVLAAVPYPVFDLARFFAPKELAVNTAALLLAVAGLRKASTLKLDATDLFLAVYLLFSALSALLAGDTWISATALALTFSGAVIYWSARSAAEHGARDAIIKAIAFAAVIGAVTSLAQAYGLDSPFFSEHRVPGGTMANRNFVAHMSAICAPTLVLAALRARGPFGVLCGAAGMAVLADALVLSRSRAAWLGLALGTAVMLYGLWRVRARQSDGKTPLRLTALTAAALLGVTSALFVPNTLEWRSDSPYLDTASGIVNYHSGSGHGRLVQYTRTARMTAAHPFFGVGPGNWMFFYPKYIKGFDPSINYATGLTMNPWPSSDWLAIISERGIPAILALLAALAGLFFAAIKSARKEQDSLLCQNGIVLSATIITACAVACFDPVLLLPASSLAVWAAAGALAPERRHSEIHLSVGWRALCLAAVLIAGAAGVLRNCGQVTAMAVYSGARTMSNVKLAAKLDPGNVRIRTRLAIMRANH